MQQAEYYENDTTLAQYLEFHFGERWHGEANFPKALADAAMHAMDGRFDTLTVFSSYELAVKSLFHDVSEQGFA